jgi:hypothetical protein
MLGFALTSVFFFLAVRQRATVTVQRDTIELINEREFIESYASYLMNNPSEKPVIDFDGITGSLTQNVEEITGTLDINETATFHFDGRITLEWNACDTPARGDIQINNSTYTSFESVPCETFHDLAGPVNVGNPFTLRTLNAPLAYRIKGDGLRDNEWHLDLASEKSLIKPVSVVTRFTTETTVSSADVEPSFLAQEITNEALWMLGAVRNTGSLLTRPDSMDIIPYQANRAAIALLKLGTDYADEVKAYMEWYLKHILKEDDGTDLGAIGVIYNYSISAPPSPDSSESSEGIYSSANAYAGTFLTLARNYLDVTRDDGFIRVNLNDIKRVAAAIDATYSSTDHLTHATPQKVIAGLKDNVDAWLGYRDASELMKAMNDLSGYRYYRDLALTVRQAIESELWDEVVGAYKSNSAEVNASWNPFSPNAESNLWTTAFLLPEAQQRVSALTAAFLAEHEASWKTVTLGAPYTWIAVALAEADEFELVNTYDTALMAIGKFGNRPSPWNLLDSAGRIEYLLKLLESQGFTYEDFK